MTEQGGTARLIRSTVCFSGIPIGISSRSDFMARFCRDYLSRAEPLFSVSVSDEQIKKELAEAAEHTGEDHAEALCLYREIAEKLPLYGRVVFHGAAIEYGGRAYVFTAPSGTGKSTHIRLWKRFFGDRVKIINGDKPILSLESGVVTVHGTPYSGKEKWQSNISAPLGGICFLSQGKDNTVSPVPPGAAFTRIFLQTYKPRTKEAMEKTAEFIRALCLVPCCALSCDISENAVRASFEALTEESYSEKKQ